MCFTVLRQCAPGDIEEDFAGAAVVIMDRLLACPCCDVVLRSVAGKSPGVTRFIPRARGKKRNNNNIYERLSLRHMKVARKKQSTNSS